MLDPKTIDVATLAFLAGSAANEYLLAQLRAAGHAQVRNSHGYLFQHLIGGPRTVGELAGLLGISQQAVSKSAAELEQLGYLVRASHASDGRVRRIELSTQGKKLIERSRAARAKLEAALTARVGARNMASARRVLLSLLEHTDALPAVAARRVKPAST